MSASRFICYPMKLHGLGSMMQHVCSACIHAFAEKAPPSSIPLYCRAVSASLRNIHTGFSTALPRNIHTGFSTALPFRWHISRGGVSEMMAHAHCCFSGSHMLKLQSKFESGEELFSIIKSATYVLEGPSHCWLNFVGDTNKFFNKEGILLVLVNSFIQDDSLVDYHDRILMIEDVKLLQKRYPKLNVIGLQCVGSVKSVIHSEVMKTIMEEYITFPVLMLDRNLIKVTDCAVYLLDEGSKSQIFYIKSDANLESIHKVMDNLSLLQKKNTSGNGDRTNQHAITEDPLAGSSLRNLLLCSAGSLSVNEDDGLIFLSDSNHHRIIITDADGKILDSIGSSPGFVDADYESAKLWRPAASFYNVSDRSLYFVDSENNAIRRADIERRLVETMYPIPKSNGIWSQIWDVWSWILNIFGLANDNMKPADIGFNPVASPWHLLKLGGDDLIIISHSFAVAWIMSMSTWKIKEVIRGFQNIYETYGNLIEEKLSFLKDARVVLPHIFNTPLPLKTIHCASLISSVGNLDNDIIICDPVGQSLLKYNRDSMGVSRIHFSNVGVLGMPYWLNCPIEKNFNSVRDFKRSIEHVHCFIVLPGRCDIRVNVDIPKGTVLAAPLDEHCTWRQARGSAAVASGLEEENTPREKVGIAQQWFDELDNLAFSNPGYETMESNCEVDNKSIGKAFQDTGKAEFECAVNVSPGTSEVIVSAVLYLTPNPVLNMKDVANLIRQEKHEHGMIEMECIRSFLDNCGEMSQIIFTKPLHLRIRLDCGDHPTAPTSKETILTDTRLEVNLTLE